MRSHIFLLCALLGCGGPPTRPAQRPAPPPAPPASEIELTTMGPGGGGSPSPVLSILQDELERSTAALEGQGDKAPYFVTYAVSDGEKLRMTAENGAISEREDGRTRLLDIDLRLGSYELDSTHPIEGMGFMGRGAPTLIPLEDDEHAIRTAIWLATDRAYKQASQRFGRVRASKTVKVEDEDRSADLSKEKPVQYVETPSVLKVDRDAWEGRLRSYSAAFKSHRWIHGSLVELQGETVNRFLVNTEGSRVQTGTQRFRLALQAKTTTDDGMELSRHEVFDALTPEDLPTDDQVRAKIDLVVRDLDALRNAPLAEPFEGPAILEGEAAAVFFHEIFGHRVEGHRQREEHEGQTFAKKIGKQVMPNFMDVYDDPTVVRAGGKHLAGQYRVDAEGVMAQRVNLVQDGILEGFLLSRTPVRGFIHSNGHGRRAPGMPVVARQGNLFVHPTETVDPDELERRLIEEIKDQGKPYGLRFRKVDGGFTTTSRSMPQAFKVLPVVVFRVYPDGREELVRGVDLEGTPLSSLSEIIAAGNDFTVFNGMCGAESGNVPVSAVSPSLLVRQVETAKRRKGRDRPPILPAPPAQDGGDQ